MCLQMIHSVTLNRKNAFTLVEMLVVIVIMSILMTVGSIGISSMGGKGVTSGVTSVEALFDEARTTAAARGLRSCVLVAKNLTNKREEDLRRVVVAYEETNTDGTAKNPSSPTPRWVLSSRGVVLPDQTFFSQKYSKGGENLGGNTVAIPEIPHSNIVGAKPSQRGSYFIYEFNSQGISQLAGATFIIGSGSRKLTTAATGANLPKATASGRRDFGGFMVMRNGRTSVFRSPEQMGIDSDVNDF